MRAEHIDRLVKLYRLALKMALIVVGLSLFAILFESCSFWLPGSACLAFGGGLSMVSFATLSTGVMAVFGMRWLLNKAQALTELNNQDEAQARAAYQRIWNFQTNAGTLVTVGAVIMIPLSIPALMMGLSGGTAVFALFGGAWLHMKARKINREIVAEQSSAPSDSNGKSGEGPSKIQSQIERGAGLAPLIVASVLLATNLIIEISFTNDLRAIPTFYNAQSTTNAGVSMSMGLSTVLDILAFSTIGLAMLIYAIVIRKRMPKKRFWLIIGITVAQLAIVQGTIAPVFARALGPSAAGANLRSQMDDAARTMEWIQTKSLPEGFTGSEPNLTQEEVNARWSAHSSAFDQAFAERTCESVIAYATDLGATDWVEKFSKTKGAVSDSAKTQSACLAAVGGYPKLKVQRYTVTSPEFILAGTSKGGAKSPFAVQLTLLKGGAGDFPNAWVYELAIHTAYNEDPLTLDGGLSQGTIEINDLLTLIAQERLAAPDRNPTDPVFVREMLKTYQHNIDIRVFETRPGVANRLELTNSDGVRMCLAIDPWNEAEQGQPDPGYGYGLGFMQDLKVLKGFGNAVEGGCKN
jgi:hypothetical protein